MLDDMQIRNLAANTQKSYLLQVSSFARHFQRSPESLGPEEIRAWQVHLTNERKLAPSSVQLAVGALRFLYRVTLRREWRDEDFPLPKRPVKLPVILSLEEITRFFRRLFLEQLRHAFDAGTLHFYGQLEPLSDAQAFAAWLAPTAQAEWVVYAKPPFGGAQHVLNYLGRYTHRVAISNNRLVRFDGDDVTFRWKD
jgi:hypothetical protein